MAGRIRVDQIVNRTANGAPQLTYGAEISAGVGLTGAGGINIAGVATVSYTPLTLPTPPYV